MYKPVDPKVDFPEMEEKILEFWEENGIFEKSIENRAEAPEFVHEVQDFIESLRKLGPSPLKNIGEKMVAGKKGAA